MRNKKPTIIPNKEGSKFTPSVVAFSHLGEIVVGTSAVLQAATNSERTIFSIKRHLGTDWKIDIDGVTYTAVNIATAIFKSLKKDAETYIEREVTQAVLAVPAYFDTKQRRALWIAAQEAGFEVLRMVAEPTTAALAYGLNERNSQQIAVYDLGGGTFDISLLEWGDEVFDVKAVNGDTMLGGDDFDERIVNYLIEKFQEKYHINLLPDRTAMIRLKEAAERAKIALSGLEEINVYVPYIYADEFGIKHLEIDLDRSRFRTLTEDLVNKTIECCKQAINDAGWDVNNPKWGGYGEVDALVLVGLSTKIPIVRESVSSLFRKEPKRGVDPDEAVALGVAIQAGVLTGDVRDVLLLDATSKSLGIETSGDNFTPLIERNTNIPTQKRQIFSTSSDNQPSIEINVLQGEHQLAKDNTYLGSFIFDGILPAPQGVPAIEVTFDIDANGALVILVMDKGTGKEERRRIDFPVKHISFSNVSLLENKKVKQSGQKTEVLLPAEPKVLSREQLEALLPAELINNEEAND